MPMSLTISALVLVAVVLMMLVELQLSTYNERLLRKRGALEPGGDVYGIMRIAYPAIFVAMAIEGVITGPASVRLLGAGLILFGGAKALKFSAIFALGVRWSFRVLVLPGAPLVTTGPYRYVRHPNYIAVCLEIAGVALATHAPITGMAGLVAFGALMRKRIAIEERALHLDRR